MARKIKEDHRLDMNGNPSGGFTRGVGIEIKWQDGPLGENPHNGAFVEDLLQACLGRLNWYQTVGNAKFACVENQDAIHYLQAALRRLDDRTAEREARGVEGTHKP